LPSKSAIARVTQSGNHPQFCCIGLILHILILQGMNSLCQLSQSTHKAEQTPSETRLLVHVGQKGVVLNSRKPFGVNADFLFFRWSARYTF
jgi:hypothetical protein